MSFKIAIPTYRRYTEVRDKTLAFLRYSGVDKECITLFVANQEEAVLYKAHNPDYTIVVGAEGLKEQRNFITDYYPENTRVVSLDDDIEGLYRLSGASLEPEHEFLTVIECAFKLCEEQKRNLWGIYPIKNSFFLTGRITTDFRFIIGHLFGFINKKLKVSCSVKEDYELSALYSLRDGGVIRLNYLCADTKMYRPGGIGSKAERQEKNNLAIHHLISTYPQFFALNSKKPGELRCLRGGQGGSLRRPTIQEETDGRT